MRREVNLIKGLTIVGLAIAAKVQFIIIEEKDLQSLDKIKEIKIVDPCTFWIVMKRKTK